MRYCDGSAECESECFDYSTDLTKVQVTESSRHKHHLPVKAPPRNVGNLCIKKESLWGEGEVSSEHWTARLVCYNILFSQPHFLRIWTSQTQADWVIPK